ncbi:MAG: YkgJ family cysteine cluster protein [Polyangiales bacterium]
MTLPASEDCAAIPDCLRCGACCRSGADGRILIPAADLARWRRQGREDLVRQTQPGHFGERAFATTPKGHCVHLGTASQPHACRIYPDRASTCREFAAGSLQCHQFRRDAGLEAPRAAPSAAALSQRLGD